MEQAAAPLLNETIQPVAKSRFWGIPNSSINWCEYDYLYSPYVAEFWNSMSSLCMTIFGMIGRYTMIDHVVGDPILADRSNNGLDRIWWTWVMLEIVGWGSVAFHGTLKWWSQALDEVPMVWTSALILTTLISSRYETAQHRNSFLYTIFRPFIPQRDPTTNKTPILSPAMWIYATICSLLITVFRGPLQFTIFHLLFGSIEVSSFVFLTIIYYQSHLYPAEHREIVRTVFRRGGISYGVGVFIWAMDLHFCEYWTIGGYQLQGHAWWHLLVSTGFYHLHVLSIYDKLLTSYRVRGVSGGPEIEWLGGVLPVVRIGNQKKNL